MATFTPPTDNVVRWKGENLLRRDFLMERLTPGARGRNVYKLTDGTYTEAQPTDATTISVLYHGGHIHDVTSAEATALTAAGYGANIT